MLDSDPQTFARNQRSWAMLGPEPGHQRTDIAVRLGPASQRPQRVTRLDNVERGANRHELVPGRSTRGLPGAGEGADTEQADENANSHQRRRYPTLTNRSRRPATHWVRMESNSGHRSSLGPSTGGGVTNEHLFVSPVSHEQAFDVKEKF